MLLAPQRADERGETLQLLIVEHALSASPLDGHQRVDGSTVFNLDVDLHHVIATVVSLRTSSIHLSSDRRAYEVNGTEKRS